MTPEIQKDIGNRMRRVAGQVAGIERMIDADRYCVDILMQIAAVQAALGRVGDLLLRSHVRGCVLSALSNGDAHEANAKIEELLEVIARQYTSRAR